VDNQRVREIDGHRIVFDTEGFFNDPQDWNPSAARVLAGEMGMVPIKDVHWQVLYFLRDYYFHHGRAPLNKQLREGLGISLLEIESLFPGGIKYGARLLAGLPNPKSCM